MNRLLSNLNPDFVNAKVRGMRSRLFEGESLTALLDSRSLPELTRQVFPARSFEGHLAFERDLAAEAARRLDTLRDNLAGPIGDVFGWLLARYQVEKLKALLHAHINQEPRAQAEPLLVPLPRRLELPTDALLDAPDLRHFAEAIPEEGLRSALMEVVRTRKTPDEFTLDIALDAAHLRRLGQLAATAGDWARRLTGFDIDRRNLLMLLRTRFSFNREYASIEYFLCPSGIFLDRTKAINIFTAPDLRGAVAQLSNGLLAEDRRGRIASLTGLDDALMQRQYELATHCFADSVLDPVSAVAFFYIKHIEMANVIRLTEGLRHSIPRNEIEESLLLLQR